MNAPKTRNPERATEKNFGYTAYVDFPDNSSGSNAVFFNLLSIGQCGVRKQTRKICTLAYHTCRGLVNGCFWSDVGCLNCRDLYVMCRTFPNRALYSKISHRCCATLRDWHYRWNCWPIHFAAKLWNWSSAQNRADLFLEQRWRRPCPVDLCLFVNPENFQPKKPPSPMIWNMDRTPWKFIVIQWSVARNVCLLMTCWLPAEPWMPVANWLKILAEVS